MLLNDQETWNGGGPLVDKSLLDFNQYIYWLPQNVKYYKEGKTTPSTLLHRSTLSFRIETFPINDLLKSELNLNCFTAVSAFMKIKKKTSGKKLETKTIHVNSLLHNKPNLIYPRINEYLRSSAGLFE